MAEITNLDNSASALTSTQESDKKSEIADFTNLIQDAQNVSVKEQEEEIDSIEFFNRTINSYEENAGKTFEQDKEIFSNVLDIVSSDGFTEKLVDAGANALESGLNSLDENVRKYSENTTNEPLKFLDDIYRLPARASDWASNAISETATNIWNKGSELIDEFTSVYDNPDELGKFGVQATRAATIEGAALLAAMVPASKAVKPLIDIFGNELKIPEGSKIIEKELKFLVETTMPDGSKIRSIETDTFNQRITYMNDDRLEDVRLYDDSLKYRLDDIIVGDNKLKNNFNTSSINGDMDYLETRDDFFSLVNNYEGGYNATWLDPYLDKTGFGEYITRAGDSSILDNNFAFVNFFNKENKVKSSNIFYTSGSAKEIDFGPLQKLADNADSNLRITFQNRAGSGSWRLPEDISMMKKNGQNSTIISAIKKGDEIPYYEAQKWGASGKLLSNYYEW